MDLSKALSWLGFVIGIFIGIPQLVKTARTKKAGDLSATTFILSLINCSCLLVRASVIKEMAFMFYYAFLLIINSLQLFLIWKYRAGIRT